jgi:hypothetical protein
MYSTTVIAPRPPLAKLKSPQQYRRQGQRENEGGTLQLALVANL